MRTNRADELREEIRGLHAAFGAGDIPERRFNRELAALLVELCGAVARERLPEDEPILAEHHVVHAHFNFGRSVLKESEQESVSFFATGRRLLRLRSALIPGSMPACDERDRATLDEIPFSDIINIKVRREIRFGEMAAGAVIAGIAVAFRPLLLITSNFMAALGVLGVLHGALMPTRWAEIETRGGGPDEPFRVHAVGKKSARVLLRLVREKMKGARPSVRAASTEGY